MSDTLTYRIIDGATCGAHGSFAIQVDGPTGPWRHAARMPEKDARKALLRWAKDEFPGVRLVETKDA